ncbi:MAG: hypothetical protein ACI9BW_004629, partial [Gammaproteobacteria bacterium]
RELGTFEMKSTSITMIAGRNRAANAQINFEGTIAGELEATTIATMTIENNGDEDGKYDIVARAIFPDGEILDANGHGKTNHAGAQKWNVAGIAEMSDGRSYAIQGEIDFSARAFTGKMFERL